MKWAVLSIPHTGTHTVLDILGGTVPNLTEKMCESYEKDDNEYFVSHIYRLPVFEVALEHNYNIVVPIRHPIKTVESWCNWQKKAPVSLEKVVGAETLPNPEQFFQPEYVLKMFKSLIWIYELYNDSINFLPVDSPKRDEYLQAVNQRYSLNLSTNWKPLNSIGEYVTTTPEKLRQATDQLLEDNKEFFSRFY